MKGTTSVGLKEKRNKTTKKPPQKLPQPAAGWSLKTRNRLDILGWDRIPAANPVYIIIEYRDFCASFLEDGFVTAVAKNKGKNPKNRNNDIREQKGRELNFQIPEQQTLNLH